MAGDWTVMGNPWVPLPKRVLIVKTEANVKRQPRPIPQPCCEVCRGHRKVKCWRCAGRGRTNCIEHVMLPDGAWPQWCEECRGSGLAYCSRCLGTGEKRGVIGFHAPNS
ncbi:uncharacterized protein LOC9662849 [Selaginella moellendorffii]|uniref:uncharacterized protein LOC9662849 n=1 Tax=Selaginella moellendorffii TaxID=88036 RepID=UPI000D1C9000|nr:uncharacterized protein LOC9662849 [Selaginella moellendorffii]|eukprot:XP_024516749.1 uncharacterized protein LOC9662849 [Selaginella moellendorffii]